MPSSSSVSTIPWSRARPPSDPAGHAIDLAHTLEVLGWSQALGCSEAELRLAVAEVGPELEEVCSHLGLPSAAVHLTALARRWH